MTEQKVIELQNLIKMLNVQSLDEPLYTRDGKEVCSIGENIIDPTPTPEEKVIEDEIREDLLKYIDKLPARECKIIRMRYGFETGEFMTLEQIATIYGVTRERIRQLECKALKKLRTIIINKHRIRNINEFKGGKL